ncbi:tigger transposable element-derived protein 1-like [Palaemon carinicauda]|uniref:tigger transposable element-derived protein 1-like n=1 Tax=Palaemon carinicauda TaxID=392227 RepID=UPI0035B659D6
MGFVAKPSMVPEGFDFKVSRGWFEKFRKGSGIHSVVRHGEVGSSDKDAVEKFKVKFANFIKAEEYLPQQIFNCDETALFWKKMPRRTYISHEKSMPGHKPVKDRFTLLLCGNASGDFKIKPLLVYHSENPRAFKGNNIMKSNLPVMWRSNIMAWLTRQYFSRVDARGVCLSRKKYLEQKKLPLRCLLVMDDAPAHPPGLEDDLTDELDFIKIKFLPPFDTTSPTHGPAGHREFQEIV